jgi:CRP/FNR family transcriptional regulator
VLTAEERALLAGIATIVRFRKGETIYQGGDTANAVFNVVTGIAKSYKWQPDQRHHIVGFWFANDLIGLAENGKYVNSAQALTAITLYRMSTAAIEARLRLHPGLDFQVIGKLCHDLRDTQYHAFLLSRHRAVAKLGLFLQMLEAQQGAGAGEVFLPMSRTDIGSYVGLSAEAVTRSLRTLTLRGIIDFRDRRHVQIIDRARLDESNWKSNHPGAET